MYAVDHQVECSLRRANHSHAVVHTAWAEPTLSNLKPTTFTEQNVVNWNTHVVKCHLGMTVCHTNTHTHIHTQRALIT